MKYYLKLIIIKNMRSETPCKIYEGVQVYGILIIFIHIKIPVPS